MSDNWIILIPEQAGLVPARDRQLAARIQLGQFLTDADEIDMKLSDKMRFEHCGTNLESIHCPDCGKEIGLEWWQQKMEADFGVDEDYKLMPYKLPCCGAMKTLHELSYEFQQGFARFSLSVMNPNIAEMPEKFVKTLETTLNCKLRFIYCHL